MRALSTYQHFLKFMLLIKVIVFDVCELVKYNLATNITLEEIISSKRFVYFIINAGPNLLL